MEKHKIELVKEIDLKDEVWYNIIIDGVHKHGFQSEVQARKLFNELKSGKEKQIEVLATFEY